jgi:hypothetical protein
MRGSLLLLLLAIAVSTGAAACGDDDEVTTPIQPTRPTVTETFSGRVTVNGAQTHGFAAGGSGRIDVTLTTLSPDSAARVGLVLGTLNAIGACQVVISNDNATQGTLVAGNAGAAGNFCARVYDVGQLTEPAEYTLTVVHF